MTDEQFTALVARLDEMQADINGGIEVLHRRIGELSDEFRRRITTTETTMINEIRALGERFDRMNDRISRLETRP